MAAKSDFDPVFDALKKIMKIHSRRLTVLSDKAGEYTLNAGFSEKWKKVIYFGGVKTGKSYVSFHLMPIYMYPDLLKGITAKLRARMQGKSCLNFKKVDTELFTELKALTKRCFDRLDDEGMV
ncbi:MAG: hypothetical protein IH877_09485 [Gemmatimonadetes bacterium]|nr:hypothetical protein [Gemmatimonadota bacterium]